MTISDGKKFVNDFTSSNSMFLYNMFYLWAPVFKWVEVWFGIIFGVLTVTLRDYSTGFILLFSLFSILWNFRRKFSCDVLSVPLDDYYRRTFLLIQHNFSIQYHLVFPQCQFLWCSTLINTSKGNCFGPIYVLICRFVLVPPDISSYHR